MNFINGIIKELNNIGMVTINENHVNVTASLKLITEHKQFYYSISSQASDIYSALIKLQERVNNREYIKSLPGSKGE